ncbi:MAG: hypothetical protein H8E71_00285 [Candidatus Marinimicrobia bacterium]|nr:hypothetical protein [Candidatus Neomarinimicrobiota bacterium]
MMDSMICEQCGNEIQQSTCPHCNAKNQFIIKRGLIKEINVKRGNPTVYEAEKRLRMELVKAQSEGVKILKIIHGWGASSVGGEIKIAVRHHLKTLQRGTVIFGEEFTPSHPHVKNWLRKYPKLKYDESLNGKNKGVTYFAFSRK